MDLRTHSPVLLTPLPVLLFSRQSGCVDGRDKLVVSLYDTLMRPLATCEVGTVKSRVFLEINLRLTRTDPRTNPQPWSRMCRRVSFACVSCIGAATVVVAARELDHGRIDYRYLPLVPQHARDPSRRFVFCSSSATSMFF